MDPDVEMSLRLIDEEIRAATAELRKGRLGMAFVRYGGARTGTTMLFNLIMSGTLKPSQRQLKRLIGLVERVLDAMKLLMRRNGLGGPPDDIEDAAAFVHDSMEDVIRGLAAVR